MTEIGKAIYKQYSQIVTKIDSENGIIQAFVNVFSVDGVPVKDSDGDISHPDSFNQTISEDFKDIYWYKNHNSNELLGITTKFEVKTLTVDGKSIHGLLATGEFNLEKEFSRNMFSDYKQYAEKNRALVHSIGVIARERDVNDRSIVLNWKLFEWSSLTKQAANDQAVTVTVKNKKDLKPEIIAKEHGGSTVVECPSCKFQFIYETAKIYKLEEQILSDARMYLRWMTEDMVYQEVNKLKPEVAMLVSQILGNETLSEKLKDSEITQKELSEKLTEYARCHKCYGVVVKSDLIKEKKKSKEINLENIEIKINLNL